MTDPAQFIADWERKEQPKSFPPASFFKCQRCGSERILGASAKCSDLCSVSYRDLEHDGYVPGSIGIGGDDYMEIDVCLDCGQMQGQWPISDETVRKAFNGEDE